MTSSPDPTVGAIVLAGGRSHRFGSDKLDVTVDGTALVLHALAAARTVSARIVVVGPERAGLHDVVVGAEPHETEARRVAERHVRDVAEKDGRPLVGRHDRDRGDVVRRLDEPLPAHVDSNEPQY